MAAGFSEQAPPGRIKGGGIYYAAAGALLGVAGVWRVLTLIQPALDRFSYYTCDPGGPSVLVPRIEAAVAIVAGILAVSVSEVGVRRNAPKWISMSASILGVFSVLAGGLIAFELFLPPVVNCS